MTAAELTRSLKAEAQQLGFTLSGACPAVTPEGLGRMTQWLSSGYAGEMHYLADRATAYEHPRHVLDGVRSLLMLAMNYRTLDPGPAAAGRGRVARYAWGLDYHDLIHGRLAMLADALRRRCPGAVARGVVDSAPLLEREFAELAGLGWVGKNSLLLNQDAGSWFFLAALLTDVELDYDEPQRTDHCGTCTACLDACPTGAFVAPYVLDSRRCISYLTIELKGPIPPELREGVGDWLFGCDVCQEVCPWNRHATTSDEPDLRPIEEAGTVELTELFWLDDEAFRARLRETPLWRPKRRGILRNAAIVLGNRPHAAAMEALVRGLADAEWVVRGAAAWALGRYHDPAACDALQERSAVETEELVRAEIEAALEQCERREVPDR